MASYDFTFIVNYNKIIIFIIIIINQFNSEINNYNVSFSKIKRLN